MKIFVVLLLGLAAAPLTAGGGSPDPVSVVRRSTLLVHDMDASVRFYRDVLGFEVWLQNDAHAAAIAAAIRPFLADSRQAIKRPGETSPPGPTGNGRETPARSFRSYR